jgi:hypothetical protein
MNKSVPCWTNIIKFDSLVWRDVFFNNIKTAVLIVLLEKKKAHRKLKNIVNKLEETPDDEELKKEKEEASLNVQYIDVSWSILWDI